MQENDKKLDLRRLWRAVKACKWVYLGLAVFFTGVGIWLSAVSLPKYTIEGDILIGDNNTEASAGGFSQMMKTFSVGGFGGSTVDNELLVMSSHDVMVRTVENIGLNRQYFSVNPKGKKVQLYRDMPLKIEAPAQYFDTLMTPYRLKIDLTADGKADIKVQKGFLNTTIKEAKGVAIPSLFDTGLGKVQLMPTESFGKSPYRTLKVYVYGTDLAATILYDKLDMEIASKLADVIYVQYKCPNDSLGMAIVNGVMNEYNAKRLDRLHATSVNEIKYYDNRIAVTFDSLQIVDNKISEYQRTNDLMGIDSEAGMLVQTSHENKQAIIQANNAIAYYEMVLSILRNRLNTDAVIPVQESLGDENIASFNDAILRRRNLVRSATDDNTALKLLDERLAMLRGLIIENSEKMIEKAKRDVALQQQLVDIAASRLDKYPSYAQEYRNMLRDREYLNQLYLYLVNQRESSVLQLYSDSPIGYIYEPAYIYKYPGILDKLLWPVALFIFSLFCSTCLAILLMLWQRKVKGPMDLASMGIESRCVSTAANPQAINILRSKIMADEKHRVIYCADYTPDGRSMQMLADSLLAIEKSVEIISGLSTNDRLLSTEVQQQIEASLKSCDYVLARIPAPEYLAEFETVVDHTDAIILVGLEQNTMLRSTLHRYLKGQTAQRIYTIICS